MEKQRKKGSRFIRYVNPRTVEKAGNCDERVHPSIRTFADLISDNDEYYPDCVAPSPGNVAEYISEPYDRVVLGGTLDECIFGPRDREYRDPTVVVLEGRKGVGKTSFIESWIKIGDRPSRCTKLDIEHFEENLLQDKTAYSSYIGSTVSADLVAKYSKNEVFLQKLDECVQTLYQESSCTALKFVEFKEQFINQQPQFRTNYNQFDGRVLLAATVSAVNAASHASAWIFIDNVDRNIPKTQEDFLVSTFHVYEVVKRQSDARGWGTNLHMVVTVRPETLRYHKGYCREYTGVDYGCSDVLEITLRTMASGIGNVKQSLGAKLKFGNGTNVGTWEELSAHIMSKLKEAVDFKDWPESLGDTTMAFHSNIVAGNVRRFSKFFVHYILTENFENLWKYRRSDDTQSPYVYIRGLIRGMYREFGGNARLTMGGGAGSSPIFVNLFEVPWEEWMTDNNYAENYLVYVRILQYLQMEPDKVSFEKLDADLNPFFATIVLEKAVKFLVGMSMIDEVTQGMEETTNDGKWTNMTIGENAEFEFSETTVLYTEHLLSEFEYVSAMAVTSHQLQNKETVANPDARQPLRSAQITLSFLVSLNEIILENLTSYRQAGVLEMFKSTFFRDNNQMRPWRGAIDGAIKALTGEIKHHEELKPILLKFEEAKTRGIEKIKETLS